MSKELKGILTALPTPFDEQSQVDHEVLKQVVDRNIDAGINALVAGGGTGEVSALSTDERLAVFKTVIDHAAGRIPVVANVGALNAGEAVKLAQGAEKLGADVLMLLSPFYEPLTLREIEHYLHTVASSVTTPIMLYNNPGVTGTNLDADTIARFGREIPNITYVKNSSQDYEQALRLIHHHGDDIKLIMGWDSYSFSALLEGATGVMAGAANVVPHEIAAVYKSLEAGDIPTARGHWKKVYPVIDALVDLPFSQAVKAGLRAQGFSVGSPREPMLDVPDDAEQKLLKALDSLNK